MSVRCEFCGFYSGKEDLHWRREDHKHSFLIKLLMQVPCCREQGVIHNVKISAHQYLKIF